MLHLLKVTGSFVYLCYGLCQQVEAVIDFLEMNVQLVRYKVPAFLFICHVTYEFAQIVII